MDEFAGWTEAAYKQEIFDLRRKLDAERTLVKQVEGANAVEASDLQAEAEHQRWCATRQETRAEAFREVIQMLAPMIGGGK